MMVCVYRKCVSVSQADAKGFIESFEDLCCEYVRVVITDVVGRIRGILEMVEFKMERSAWRGIPVRYAGFCRVLSQVLPHFCNAFPDYPDELSPLN